MPPLPDSTTQRFFLDYATTLHQHTMKVRTTSPQAATTFSTFMHAFLSAIEIDLSLITIIGLRVAQAGSNVSVPVTWGGDAAYGSDSLSPIFEPRQLNFLGRSVNGRRARLWLFGWKGVTPEDFRVERATNAPVDNAYDVLEANPGFFAAIDGFSTVKYQYANVNWNSYWEREMRS